MVGEGGGVLDKITVMEVMPGITDKNPPVRHKAARRVDDPVGDQGLEAMLVRASGVNGVGDTEGVDALNDGIADMKDKGIDVKEEETAKETAPRTEFIVDAVLGLQR